MRQWIPTAIALAALMVALPLGLASDHGQAVPANKTAAAGSSLTYLPEDFADDDAGVTILSATIRGGGPVDLLLQLSLECALWTETAVTTIGSHPGGLSDTSQARADIEVWIEMDGDPVLVDGSDDGKVTFCDRVQRQDIEDMDESTGNWTMRTYLATKSANAFNWVTLDIGSGLHTIDVKADIDAENTEGAFASGAIGKRTLIVEPTRFAQGATA